jgi:hypothetical protein
LERARALAAFGEAELQLPPTEGGLQHHATLVDQALHWALTNLKRAGKVDNPERGRWALAERPVAPERLAPPIAAQRLSQLRSMPYTAYLNTAEWQRTREAAAARAANRCQLDARHGGPVDVHHANYVRGEESSADVIVLCRACHRRYHDDHGRPGRRPGGAAAPAPAATADAPPREGLLRRGLRALLT